MVVYFWTATKHRSRGVSWSIIAPPFIGAKEPDAKLRLDFARNYMAEVQRDFPSGDIPESRYHFAHRKALRAENFAFAEYNDLACLWDFLWDHR